MSSLLSQKKDQPCLKKEFYDSSSTSSTANTRSQRHERLSRLGLTRTEVPNDSSTNHAESYFLQRQRRLSARKKAEEESMNSEYKKMYEKAVVTNERLKSRLETSKQDLAVIQEQLQTAQNQRTCDSSSKMLEAEKQVKAELKMENLKLKDENGALIRVITKLSK
ncbi:protein phosphatase 1 regulatory subunit 12B isoform X2 [Oryzias latipes]|uniref:protein phosphatase 1 regulatory subunit 12B isoform X2 n=1 Tax=Oryzias latipes TaxID=8090 RepID=UPI000CE25D80|nr:protein phosphatase 1 regulatory subunit 12B isoform X2 [Oryzias latipes]